MNRWLSALMIGLVSTSIYATDSSNTPIGYWKTLDDATGKPKSIVEIWKADNDVLMGKVIKVFPQVGEPLNKVCDKCTGNLHNQPVVGMVILSGLKSNENQWGNGQILDPDNGKTYKVTLRMAHNGNKLDVHGYIGIPLLGHSQTWERVDLRSGC